MPKNRIREITIDIEDPDHSVNSGGYVQAYVSNPHNGQGDPDPDIACFWAPTLADCYHLVWMDADGKEVSPPPFAKCVEGALRGFLEGRDQMDSDVAEDDGLTEDERFYAKLGTPTSSSDDQKPDE